MRGTEVPSRGQWLCFLPRHRRRFRRRASSIQQNGDFGHPLRDVDLLRAQWFATATVHARTSALAIGEEHLVTEARAHHIVEGMRGIEEFEVGGDVYAVGTRHAIAAASARDHGSRTVSFTDRGDQSVLRGAEGTYAEGAGVAQVFFDLAQGTHAAEHDGNLWLIP